jgi:hypothetical protein
MELHADRAVKNPANERAVTDELLVREKVASRRVKKK